MRTIILASRSTARKRLLRQTGLSFKVAVARVKESHSLEKGCPALVMENARKKAEVVAGRFSSGIVIAADTVVLVGNKIIGKPRNMQDAFRTLQLLSKRPQWVYTGLAVIDIDNKRLRMDYEKTKIYMYRLTGRQIRNYFKRVCPLDKAGSFDIQGLGGIFIDRIEGCFYNVVGLPLAKLAKMLSKMGLDIFDVR
ncbi:MAG: Maf family protein [Candidatus Omnitrophota bacterium]